MTDATYTPGAQRAADDAVAAPSVATVGDYLVLLKPRVMSLVLLTAIAGMAVAPGTLHPALSIVAVLCIAVGAGASGAINMWYDRDIDAVMARTSGRPIPTGRIAPEEALAFGVILSVFAVMTMGLALNWAAAGMLALTIGFYVFVYTIWLKRRTPQNIVIGGAAGAFPPMIGWAAVSGDIGLPSLALFALIFFWTPPHFWALALFRKIDYAKAGIPMLPVVAGVRETKRQMFVYTVLLLPIAAAPAFLGIAGWLYLGGALLLGANFLRHAWIVLRTADVEIGDPAIHRPAKRMFGFSILYLFGLFVLVLVDGGLGLTAPLADLVAAMGA
ncbi:MAG: heme o synthase [Alphaproteobacteria bacterium]